MECSNIQQKLSAYIEEILSPEERILINGHLNSCHKCSQALSDLRKTMEYIKNLEEVEPPPWLTQKVMARIRSEAGPAKRVIQRLFYPLHVKLPIEVAATIAIAITTIYIFRTIQPEVRLAKAPAEVITSEEKAKKDVIPPSPPLKKGGEVGFTAEQPKPAKKPELFEIKKAPEAPAPAGKQQEVMQYTGAISKDEVKGEGLSPAPKLKETMDRRKADSISLTLNVRDLESALIEVEKAVTRLGGKIIKTEALENKNTLTAELDAEKIKELSGRLKALGEIKEKETALETQEGKLEIRIEIIKTMTMP